MKESRFYAYISRMKHIFRWSLMKNSQNESLSVHTLDTAVIAHCLGLLRNRRFGGNCNVERLVMLAMYHDCSEILTGDMPTPVKYYNSNIKSAYDEMERNAVDSLVGLLPDDLKEDFYDIFDIKDEKLKKIVRAADKISALIKCKDEIMLGNSEFSVAEKATLKTIKELKLPAADEFLKEFLDSFSLPLDEQK